VAFIESENHCIGNQVETLLRIGYSSRAKAGVVLENNNRGKNCSVYVQFIRRIQFYSKIHILSIQH
jgi:hypothetical protein